MLASPSVEDGKGGKEVPAKKLACREAMVEGWSTLLVRTLEKQWPTMLELEEEEPEKWMSFYNIRCHRALEDDRRATYDSRNCTTGF